jgi:hypothetical protein
VTDDLEIGEVGLPQLVGPGGLVAELVCRFDHYMRRGRDQVLGLENAIGRGLRDKIAFLVGVFDRQFPGREVLVVQRELDESFADVIRDAVQHGSWSRRAIRQCLKAAINPTRIPIVVGAAGDARRHGWDGR